MKFAVPTIALVAALVAVTSASTLGGHSFRGLIQNNGDFAAAFDKVNAHLLPCTKSKANPADIAALEYLIYEVLTEKAVIAALERAYYTDSNHEVVDECLHSPKDCETMKLLPIVAAFLHDALSPLPPKEQETYTNHVFNCLPACMECMNTAPSTTINNNIPKDIDKEWLLETIEEYWPCIVESQSAEDSIIYCVDEYNELEAAKQEAVYNGIVDYWKANQADIKAALDGHNYPALVDHGHKVVNTACKNAPWALKPCSMIKMHVGNVALSAYTSCTA